MLLKDKVAIVTGAAKGIGRAVSDKFVEHGAIVVEVDITYSHLSSPEVVYDSAGKQISTRYYCDVSQYDQLKEIVDRTFEKHGRIDIVVNNAGVNIPGGVEEITESQWDLTQDVNVKSQFLMTKLVSPIMRRQASGVIINMASANSVVSEKRLVSYVTSKGAIKQFTQASALDLAPYGVRVNCIGPGLVNTGFNDAHHDLVDGGWPEVMKQIKDIHPIGREVYPEEIADTAVFLASDLSKAIVGQLILVDGGFSIK